MTGFFWNSGFLNFFFTGKSISEIHVKSAENRGTERGGDGVEG